MKSRNTLSQKKNQQLNSSLLHQTQDSTPPKSWIYIGGRSFIIFILAALVINFALSLHEMFLEIKNRFVKKEHNKLYAQLAFVLCILILLCVMIIILSYTSFKIEAQHLI
jgi:hypothetical protein